MNVRHKKRTKNMPLGVYNHGTNLGFIAHITCNFTIEQCKSYRHMYNLGIYSTPAEAGIVAAKAFELRKTRKIDELKSYIKERAFKDFRNNPKTSN